MEYEHKSSKKKLWAEFSELLPLIVKKYARIEVGRETMKYTLFGFLVFIFINKFT